MIFSVIFNTFKSSLQHYWCSCIWAFRGRGDWWQSSWGWQVSRGDDPYPIPPVPICYLFLISKMQQRKFKLLSSLIYYCEASTALWFRKRANNWELEWKTNPFPNKYVQVQRMKREETDRYSKNHSTNNRWKLLFALRTKWMRVFLLYKPKRMNCFDLRKKSPSPDNLIWTCRF